MQGGVGDETGETPLRQAELAEILRDGSAFGAPGALAEAERAHRLTPALRDENQVLVRRDHDGLDVVRAIGISEGDALRPADAARRVRVSSLRHCRLPDPIDRDGVPARPVVPGVRDVEARGPAARPERQRLPVDVARSLNPPCAEQPSRRIDGVERGRVSRVLDGPEHARVRSARREPGALIEAAIGKGADLARVRRRAKGPRLLRRRDRGQERQDGGKAHDAGGYWYWMYTGEGYSSITCRGVIIGLSFL